MPTNREEIMMNNRPNYGGMVKRQIRLFYGWLILMVLVPIIAWLWPWLPDGETPSSFFQRSGSAILAFGLLAELSAVKVYTIFNPSGQYSREQVELEKEYGRYPSIMTYVVLIGIAIGTLISGYGDLL